MVLITESIAVQLVSPKKLIYGIGTELRIADDEKEPKLLWECPRKIHGIDSSKHGLLVWGERYFSQFSVHEEKILLQCKGKLTDWISSGKLLSDDEFCLLTAHSVALRLKARENEEPKILDKSSCSDKSTMYCSFLLGDKWMDLTIFGGNAFGEIIIWKPKCCANQAPVLRRLNAHQGVVFSIYLNPVLGLLTTTSDDRSVRFWNFPIEDENEIDWKNASIDCRKSSYGHSARVFQSKIIKKDNHVLVVSCGEDQCMCLWSSNGELVGKIKKQMGAILDCAYDNSNATLFASTSSGNVFKYDIQNMLTPICFKEINLTLEGHYVSKVKFLGSTHIIGLFSSNKLFVADMSGNFKYLESISNFKVTVLEVFETSVFIGGYKNILLFKFSEERGLEKVFDGPIVDGLIRYICAFSSTEILISSENGQCIYSCNQFADLISFITPNCKERWITAAMKIHNFLVVSNRQGSLFLYVLTNGNFSLTSTIKNVHGYLGVTKMLFEKQLNNEYYFRTSGHDSTIKRIRINKTSCKLDIVHTENVPVPWIVNIIPNRFNEHKTMILGFNDNHFVVWERKSSFLHELSCGGGHRCWDAKLDFQNNELKYICIKNKRLHFCNGQLENVSSNKIKLTSNKWHVKICNVLKAFPFKEKFSKLLLSGGEDNLLKCSILDLYEENCVRVIKEVFLHISSIKSIHKVEISTRTWLIFSAGGRAQICVIQMNLDDLTVEEKCNFMLKASDFERKYQRNRQEIDFDPETRIMSLVAYKNSEEDLDEIEIFAGCSDGYIRKLKYKNGSIELSSEIFYGKCILHVRLLKTHSEHFLVTCATDGLLCFWHVKDFVVDQVPFFILSHHESGINSLDIKIHKDILYIATGGDDQSVVISKINTLPNFYAMEKRTLDYLHTAQINGVYITKSRKYLYTTGVDQKVCKVNMESYQIESSVFVNVADAKGLEICESLEDKNICIVYGCGLQTIEL